MTTTTLALCPDCGQPYVWQTHAATFRCSCTDPDDRQLAVEDIYLEHDETWTTDRFGRLVSIRTERVVDWTREESDPCQANTPGCCIDHNRDDGSCETW